MDGDKSSSITLLHQIPLNESKDVWCISDMSLLTLDIVVVSGCEQKSKKTFIKVFSETSCKTKLLYSQEFNKQYTSDLWRLVSFLDDSHLVTCFDDQVEKISIKKDKTVQSWKLPKGGASCISVKEREVFIGFSASCDVIILNSSLRQVRTVTLDGLQDGWPVDIMVVPDMILVCSFGCVPIRALCFAEEDGKLLREYTKPRSDDAVPLSLTVSVEADLVAVLWNSPPQLTVHSFFHGHCLVVADVEPAERIRSVGQDKLVMVDEKGEMKVFLLEQILTYHNLKAILALLLVDGDCRDIEDFFGISCDQDNKTECSDADKENKAQDMKNQRLLTSLEESGNISLGNVTTLLEALKELDKSDSLISPVEAYQKYAGCHRGRKRTRKKSPQVKQDDHLKKKKRITEDASPKDDSMDESTRQEEQASSNTKKDSSTVDADKEKITEDASPKDEEMDESTRQEEQASSNTKQGSSTDDADKEKVTTSSKEMTQQDTPISPSSKLNECKSTPKQGEVGSPCEQDNQEIVLSVEVDSIAGVSETDHEEVNDRVEQGEAEQRINDGPTLKERMVTMLGEIQALKQQNELIVSLLRTHIPTPFLYPQQYSCTHQCSQHPSQSMHVNTPINAHSQPIQQVQAPGQVTFQAGLAPTAQPYHPTQLQPLAAVQPTTALPPSQPTNPHQPVTPLPQIQFPTHSGTPVSPCTCKVHPQPQATSVLTQAVSAPPGSAVPSNSQPSNTPLYSTPPSKSIPLTSTSCTTTQVPLPPPTQPSHTPNPHMTVQPSVPIYAYNQTLALPYFSGIVPSGSHVQFAPYPASQLAPALPQGPGQPASNPPSQVYAQPVTVPPVSQQTLIVPPSQISVTPSRQAASVQPPSQNGTTPVLSPTPSPSSNRAISLYNQPVMDQSSLFALWQSLPQNVQEDIAPHKGADNPKARDRIARRLIRHFFTSEVRARSNCTGVLGYKALDPEKLYHTKCLVFYLCPVRSGTVEAECVEWKRLIKVIDTFNRNHRRFTNTKKAFLYGGSTENVENGL